MLQLVYMLTSCFLIAEHISTRLWMRDLFSGCGYVRTCIHAHVLVTLRNVNLQSQWNQECWFDQNVNLRSHSEYQFEVALGMSVWGHAQNVSLRSCSLGMFHIRNLGVTDAHITRGRRDNISLRWRTGRTARLGLDNIGIWQSKCRNECWNVAKKQRSQSTIEAKRTRKISKVESTYCRVFTCQVLGSLFTLLFCTVFWAPTKPATHNSWYLLRAPHLHVQGIIC